MNEAKKKYREVSKTLDAWSRFLILDELLRNRNNYYLLNDLVDKVNDALGEYGYASVSKRTIQEDLKFMKSELRQEVAELRYAIQQIDRCPHRDACPVIDRMQRQPKGE